MEALVAVNGSLITIYDMCKGISKDMQITDIKLLKKLGSKSGDWKHYQNKLINLLTEAGAIEIPYLKWPTL